MILEHEPGDLSCEYCDTAPLECKNCGGIVHFNLSEVLDGNMYIGIPLVEEKSECDGCGPDYIL